MNKIRTSCVLDHFEIEIGSFLSFFSKSMFRNFNIQLRDTYLTDMDHFQRGVSRVDLRLAHDRGFIWDREKLAHNANVEGN